MTSTFGTNTRRTVLTAYFLAAAALKTREIDASPKQESALLAAALSKKASVFALFGGQGTNEVYFGELQNLYDIYKPFVAPFVQTITEEVLAPLVAEEEASTHYMFGLDVVSWPSGAACSPCCPLSCLGSRSYWAYSLAAGSIFQVGRSSYPQFVWL